MEGKRSFFSTAAIAAIGLAVLAAALAAIYMIVSSLSGSPTPAPTAMASPAPTPYQVIPSGPVGSTATPAPTAGATGAPEARLAGGGTDRDTYQRGDTASTYIIIENTGTVPVDEATLDIGVERYVSIIGYVKITNTTTTLSDLNITPGDTAREEYSITIPEDYNGLSTAGKFRFTVGVIVGGKKIGEFQKEVIVE